MIKSFIILAFAITTCLSRAFPNDVPLPDSTEQTGIATDDATKHPMSENTQEMSKEAVVEARSISESSEHSTESKIANSENTESNIQQRSTDDGAANSENTDEPVIKTNPDSDMSITSENSEVSTAPDPIDSKSDEVTRTSRNSEGNGSAELKSASVETETGEDVSHIHVKEQTKQAPEEDTPSQGSASEEKSQTASEEKESKGTSDSEQKSADEDSTQVKTASSEENSGSTADESHTNTPETKSGVAGLIEHGADALFGPPVNRRMFNDNNDHSSHKYDEVERHSTEAADTRMAPQEEPRLPGHQVHNNYLDGSRSSQSQYPYSPLEDSNRNPPNYQNRPSLKEPKNADPEATSDKPFLKLIPPITSRSGYPDIPLLNPAGKNQNEPRPWAIPTPLNTNQLLKPVPQLLPHLNDAIRPLPLPTPQTFGPFKPLPLQPLPQTFRPMPLLPLEPLPPLPSLGRLPFKPDCAGCHNFPIQNWQPQHTFPRLLPSWPRPAARNSMNMQPVNNSPNMLSMFRQGSEVLPFSDSVSGNWNTAFQTAPYTVRSSVRSFATGFSSF